MRLRFFLTSVIFVFCGMISRAQVTEILYQGFETGETVRFVTTPSESQSFSTTLYCSGERCLDLEQQTSGMVTMVLDTMDFTGNTTLRYIAFEFDHICSVQPAGSNLYMCKLYYKLARESENDWHPMTGLSEYDRTGNWSSSFASLDAFNSRSYSEWTSGPYTNDVWKSERFNLNDVFTNVAPSDRKLLIKLEVAQKTGTGNAGHWWIDNMRVRASSSQMVKPSIKMALYPDAVDHPSSRGARIMLDARTELAEGINADSVYLVYRVGDDPTQYRIQLSPVTGTAGRFKTTIPFYGYDTMMYFYCVARDLTSNSNMATFPATSNSWVEYRCVRGQAQPGILTPQFTGTNPPSGVYWPFCLFADNCSEFVYDSATLHAAGYGPGSITALRFTSSNAINGAVTRPRFQLKMKNAPTNYTVDVSIAEHYPFTRDYMHVVYNDALTLRQANQGDTQTIFLQDTFYYAGKDIVMQVLYDGDVDATTNNVKMISTATGKPSIWLNGYDAGWEVDLIANPPTEAQYQYSVRPAFVFTEGKNQPLYYDMGFDTLPTASTYGLLKPNFEVPMTPDDHSIQVRLKNQGLLTVNGIRISYSIDSGAVEGHFDWSGTLAGLSTTPVTIAPNVQLDPGTHTLKVWVEDTLTAAGQHYRDHEPYNDTVFAKFIVCAGPMHGERRIGGTNPDFNSMEDFLIALNRCGMDDTLVVKLAPGRYSPFTLPAVDGLTAAHYLVFEPQGDSVIFSYDSINAARGVSSLVNLEAATYVRFRNITFERTATAGTVAGLSELVKLGQNSVGCRFESCSFIDRAVNPQPARRIGAMVNTGYTNNILVENCKFRGGKIGIDVEGMASDVRASTVTIRRNTFHDQYENAIKAQNLTDVVIDKNEMYDVKTNASYVLFVNECYGNSRVTANKIYTSHGAGAVGVGKAVGTAAVPFILANNMVVCDDDGSSNSMSSAFSVIQATYADVVYNSVKMTAPTRRNVATATFGGGVLQNSRFVNNIVVCLDENNYALNFVPGSETSNTVNHNIYYTMGTNMNRRSGAYYPNLSAWLLVVEGDSNSVSVNPNFLNGTMVDLRTYNRQVKGVGMPLSTVTTDMFDTVRDPVATCPGAFEFVSLNYDFEPEALLNPVAESCNMPAQSELVVRLRNSGTSAYTGNTMTLNYQVNAGTPASTVVTDSVPADDTVTIHTGLMVSLPAVGTSDVSYNVRVWTSFAADPNKTNDTNVFVVLSKYHPAAPADVTVSIDYATAAYVTPTAGVDTWKVYESNTAPRDSSILSWYHSMADAEPFFVGPTLVTDTIRQDTTFYFRQHRALPIVRLTQVEVKISGAVGSTPNAPYWLNSNRTLSIQLTNIGDAPANLMGDTLRQISAGSSSNTVKNYVFGDVTLAPGASLVLQNANGNSTNPAMTIHTGSTSTFSTVNSVNNYAFVYKRNGVVEDAVALNGVTTANPTKPNSWASQNVPSYVWNGAGISITNANKNTAGLVRTGFSDTTTTAQNWRIATANNPMMLNATDESWIRYTDNGCVGDMATATVTIMSPPLADISVGAPVLPSASCGMGMENVTVTLRNYGVQRAGGLVLHYSSGTNIVTETVTDSINANGTLTYTFNTPINLAFPHDTTVSVKVWVDSVAGDLVRYNDTNRASVTTLFTPSAPVTVDTSFVSYGERDTMSLSPAFGLIPVWYDYEGNVLDTGYTNVSEILYFGGTRGVSYLVYDTAIAQVGTGTSVNGKTAYPAPYQPSSKFAKQQYIYSAYELQSAGLKAGYIDSIAFYLDSLYGTVASINFDNYTLSLGLTSDTIFSSNTAWKTTTPVYHRAPQTLYRTSRKNWVTHVLDERFYWDGVSSIVVQVVHENSAVFNTGVQSTYTTKPNTTLHKNGSSAFTPSTMNYVGTGTKGANRPNIRFNGTDFGCESPIATYQVQMTNLPAVDLAALWPIDGIDTLHYNSCGNTSFNVRVRNQGSTATNDVKVYYYFDTLSVDSIVLAVSIPAGAIEDVPLFTRQLMPGRHQLTAVVNSSSDEIHTNDTVSMSFLVRFCGGNYTIAAANANYHSFGEAIDTLNVAGIEGPVTFSVAEGTYEEQVVLNTVRGTSDVNTVKFIGTGDNVLLTAATTQDNNYVFMLDSASNVMLSRFRIEARPTATGNAGNYANALVMQKGSKLVLDSITLRVKGTVNNANASCLVLGENLSDLTIRNCTLDSGFYSIKATTTAEGYNNVDIHENHFTNFWKVGVYLRSVNNLLFKSNIIRSGSSIANRSLKGLYISQTSGNFRVEKNQIYLIDTKTGGKLGMQLENIGCTSANPGFIVNNMISGSGTGTADLSGMKPGGIWIDSSSANLKVLYNTVRIFCGNVTAAYAETSNAFFTGATVSDIQVMNNIFSNFSKGYAYYVSELNTVTVSNFNGYYTESSRPFYWKQMRATLAALQHANSDDVNSCDTLQPYFAAEDDLHLVMTNFVGKAQYTDDVIEDIDGTARMPIPEPTMGAHEMVLQSHDMAVVGILSPYVPNDTNFSYPNRMPVNIEGDSVFVKAQFYNNGRSIETNVMWYAYIEGHEAETRTPNINLGTFTPAQMKVDSVMMPTVHGIINRHNVHVVVLLPSDTSLSDNDRIAQVFLAPAYNFLAQTTSVVSTVPTGTPEGCGRKSTTLRLTVKNAGFKSVPAGTELKIGFHPEITSPANTTVSTMPDTVEAVVPLASQLLINQTVMLSLPDPVNLYPTGLNTNLKVRIKGWVHHDLDVVPANDSTTNSASSSSVIDAFYIPAAPVGYDTIFPYGTWGGIRASQEVNRPIRWYTDSTASAFYQPSQYVASTRWNNTPQYFDSAVYYLNYLSDKNCPSPFSEVHVRLSPRIPNNMAMVEVLAPLGDRVYMEDDTVRVRISNHGTQTQNDIPITFQLKRGNTIVQTITESCREAVAPDQDYVYTFDRLLDISTPTTSQSYTLNVWTDLPNDGVRRADTLRSIYTFRSLAESLYGATKPTESTFDVTRISFNEIDMDIPPLGRGYTELAAYDNPEYPVLHITKGTVDSLILQVTPFDAEAQANRVKVWVFIDFDRSGTFNTSNELLIPGDVFYDNTIYSGSLTIPHDVSYGYMRMRICVGNYADYSSTSDHPVNGIAAEKDGHTLDFLLFVDEEPRAIDLSVAQIVSPRSYLIRDGNAHPVSFRVANKGAAPVTNPSFFYQFTADRSLDTGTVTYNGTIQPGRSAIVTLPAHAFPFGTTNLVITSNLEGDLNLDNNTLRYEYNRFREMTVILEDQFEVDNKWYAPTGYNEFSRNYWQLGTPTKTKIQSAYSDSNAWVTDLHSPVVSGKRGNVSYLYSPILYIAQIKCDTLSFYLRRNLLNGSNLTLEYYSYEDKWVKVDFDSATNWYNNVEDRVFDGTSAGNSYNRYWIKTTSGGLSGNFNERLQFRFVYRTPIGTSATSSFGDGCAIDNVRIGRAQRDIDCGVIAILEPEEPRYGQTIYPKVVVKNYGYDTIRSLQLGYTHYGTNLPKILNTTCLIPPNEGVDTFLFTSPFVITSDYPDTFYLKAFTNLTGEDLYRDNDTMSRLYHLFPLDNDISAHSFVYPLSSVIASDSTVQVTLRMRNFGQHEIPTAQVSYLVNGRDRVDESINFEDYLGRPLRSMEYFNYTFNHKLMASMGIMQLTGIVKCDSNEYVYNDTVTKRINGISSVNDMAAAAMIVDTSGHNEVRFEIVIENRGARGANNFEVGFYIDNDTNTMHRETYYRAQPLPALSTGYHMFNLTLPTRPANYPNVTGFVHLPNDIDRTNDTTSSITTQFVDLEMARIVVEENASPMCRVFVQLRNNGNLDVLPSAFIQIRGTINGVNLSFNANELIHAGETRFVELLGTQENPDKNHVPKSPTRTYTGNVRFTLSGDANTDNNESTFIEVFNYFDPSDVPAVDKLLFSLDQNYPNPHTGRTTIPFTLPAPSSVRFFVIDAMGHMVNSFERLFGAGPQSITIDMSAYASGFYYYGIEVDGQRQMKKMILR